MLRAENLRVAQSRMNVERSDGSVEELWKEWS